MNICFYPNRKQVQKGTKSLTLMKKEYTHRQFQRAPAKHRECPDIRVKIDKAP